MVSCCLFLEYVCGTFQFNFFRAPSDGGLYLAGIPPLVSFAVNKARMAQTTAGFQGNIRDVVFINKELAIFSILVLHRFCIMFFLIRSIRVLRMNEPVTFSAADIGRVMEFPDAGGKDEERSGEERGDLWLGYPSGAPSSCQSSPSDLFLEEGLAAHFSRNAHSSVMLKLKKEEVQRDFLIDFDIRTFDQDGLLFAFTVRNLRHTCYLKPLVFWVLLLQHSKQKLIVYLQDTEMRVDFHQRDGTVREIELTDNYSDGVWKRISVEKDGSRLTLSVADESDAGWSGSNSVSMTVPRKLHIGRSVWIGGSEEAVAPGGGRGADVVSKKRFYSASFTKKITGSFSTARHSFLQRVREEFLCWSAAAQPGHGAR